MLPNYNELIKTIKKTALEAVEASSPVNVCYGTVVSESPLQIEVDQKITLGSAQLILTKNVTDYSIDIDIDVSTDSNSHKHDVKKYEDGVLGSEIIGKTPDYSHSHSIKKKLKIKIPNALKKGEEVILIRQQEGQKYIVLDRVVN